MHGTHYLRIRLTRQINLMGAARNPRLVRIRMSPIPRLAILVARPINRLPKIASVDPHLVRGRVDVTPARLRLREERLGPGGVGDCQAGVGPDERGGV